MNSVTIKVIGFFLSLFIIITVIGQIYISMHDKKHTEEALFYTVSDTVSFKGIFVRKEKPILYDGNGVLNYINPDGSKIAKNSPVAEVYSNESEISSIKKIDELKSQIELIKRVINQGTTSVAQPEFITKQIDEKYIQLENFIEHNDFEKINITKNEILILMSILNRATNVEDIVVFNDKINQLQSEIDNLTLNISPPSSTILSDETGYFVSYVDGFEDKLTLDYINSISVDEINGITSKPLEKNTLAVGKIIDGYTWKLVGIVNISDRFIQGTNVNIKIAGSGEIIPVYVESLTPIDEQNNFKIVLSCDRLNYNLVQNRVEKIEIVFNEYSGIKIPRDAIYFENGLRGVYVALGNNVVFRKIDVIYEGEDFVISKNTKNSENVLLYDKILFEGVKKLDTTSSG